MKTWKTKIEIKAPVQKVWETIINFKEAHKWNPNVSSSTILTPMPIGNRTKVEVKSGSRRTYLILTEFEPYKFLSADVEMGKTIGKSEFLLSSINNTTIIEHTMQLELKGFAKLFSIFIASSLKKKFQAMKNWIEKENKS